MTVFTKPISERKKKSPLDVPLVEAEQPVAGTDVVVHVPAGNKNGRSSRSIDTEHLAVSEHRVTSATTVCLFLVGLLVMSIGVVGGIYLYQQCARKPVSEAEMQRLRGFLNGPFNSTDNRGLFGLLDSQRQTDLPEVSALDTRKSNYDIMASTNEPERRRGQFVHDFSINKTGIVDVDGKRCFVIPLDRDAVIFLPSFVLEMARKMTNKHTDVRVIVKTMKIQFPRLTDLSTLGESIARECSGMKTYSLVRANLGPVFKRSADESVVFDDATGSTLQIEIVNFKELERIEEEEIKNGRNGVI